MKIFYVFHFFIFFYFFLRRRASGMAERGAHVEAPLGRRNSPRARGPVRRRGSFARAFKPLNYARSAGGSRCSTRASTKRTRGARGAALARACARSASRELALRRGVQRAAGPVEDVAEELDARDFIEAHDALVVVLSARNVRNGHR